MSRVFNYVPRVAIFLAGVAAAALTMPRREHAPSGDKASLDELKKALADLQARVESRESVNDARFTQVETKLDEHAAKLADVPSTAQIVAAMEQLLTKTMASLDDRLGSQARSIEVLRTTVSQTDSLLERVLESLDTLQGYSDSAGLSDDPLLSRPAV
jgi:chromosome segregation ATPase